MRKPNVTDRFVRHDSYPLLLSLEDANLCKN